MGNGTSRAGRRYASYKSEWTTRHRRSGQLTNGCGRETSATSGRLTRAVAARTAGPWSGSRRSRAWADAASPVPVPGHVRDSLREAISGRLPGNFRNAQAELTKGLFLPNEFPPVTGLGVGSDRKIWVRRELPVQSKSVVWDLLSPNGIRIAELALPAEFDFKESRDDSSAALGSRWI